MPEDDYYIDHLEFALAFIGIVGEPINMVSNVISNSIERISTNRQNNWMSWQKHQNGRQRYMQVNPTWNYYKAKSKSTPLK